MTDVAQQLPPALGPGERLLRLAQVLDRVPVSTPTIYRWMRSGRFPRNYQIGPNSVVWLESEVNRFIAETASTAA